MFIIQKLIYSASYLISCDVMLQFSINLLMFQELRFVLHVPIQLLSDIRFFAGAVSVFEPALCIEAGCSC